MSFFSKCRTLLSFWNRVTSLNIVLQAEFSTAGGEATFARFFQLDEAMDEFSSRRNSVSSIAAFNGGGIGAGIEDGIRVREAMETHAVLLLRVSSSSESRRSRIPHFNYNSWYSVVHLFINDVQNEECCFTTELVVSLPIQLL